MAQEIRAVMAAISRGDWEAALSYVAPDVKWDTSRQLNETRGIYETREGVRRAWERFAEPWESWRVENEFVQVGQETIVTAEPATFGAVTGSR
jgi:ketosteroid isomerase-like protein